MQLPYDGTVIRLFAKCKKDTVGENFGPRSGFTYGPGLLASAESLELSNNQHRSAYGSSVVKVDDVVIRQANAAVRDRRSYQPWLVGTMQTELGVMAALVEVEGARTKRVVLPAGHAICVLGKPRLASYHVGCGCPGWPLCLVANCRRPFEGKALLANGNAVACCPSTFFNGIQITLRDIGRRLCPVARYPHTERAGA